MASIDILPDDVFREIISHLDIFDTFKLEMTCTALKKNLPKYLSKLEFPIHPCSRAPPSFRAAPERPLSLAMQYSCKITNFRPPHYIRHHYLYYFVRKCDRIEGLELIDTRRLEFYNLPNVLAPLLGHLKLFTLQIRWNRSLQSQLASSFEEMLASTPQLKSLRVISHGTFKWTDRNRWGISPAVWSIRNCSLEQLFIQGIILDKDSGECMRNLRSLTIQNSGAKAIISIPGHSFKNLEQITLIHAQTNDELFLWLDTVLFNCNSLSRLEIDGLFCGKEKKATFLATMESLNFQVTPVAPASGGQPYHFVWTKIHI